MRWFGPSWHAPVCEEGKHVPVPIGELCESCGDAIEARDQGLVLAFLNGETWRDFPVHLDCLMRMVGAET